MRWFARVGFLVAGLGLYPLLAFAATEADIYWLGGTSSTGKPIFIPATSTNPIPTACQ